MAKEGKEGIESLAFPSVPLKEGRGTLMKIGIVSDTHGCVESWRKTFSYLSDAEVILHAGDVLYHGPRNNIPQEYQPAELVKELNSCTVPLVFAAGNCDAEVDGMVLEAPLQNPFAFVQWEGLRILLSHGHRQSVAEKEELAKKYKVQLFIEGHTHLPVLEKKGDCVFLNPGSTCMPKTADKRATFAVLEEGTISICYVDTGEIYQTMAL